MAKNQNAAVIEVVKTGSRSGFDNLSLDELATEINSFCDEGDEFVRAGIHRYKQAGERLIVAKERVAHGGWEDWLRENTRLTVDTASRYMWLAKHWSQAEPLLEDDPELGLARLRRIIGRANQEKKAKRAPDGFVSRRRLLDQLKQVRSGLDGSPEQSECFVFRDDEVITYNEDLLCRRSCDLSIEGAVPARYLLQLLDEYRREQIPLKIVSKKQKQKIGRKTQAVGKHFLQSGGRDHGDRIRLEPEIRLPIDEVETPGEWNPLPDDFDDAVKAVWRYASTDYEHFELTCIHVTPTHLETCNNFEIARYQIQMPIKQRQIIPVKSLRRIVGLGMTEVHQTSIFLHFKNNNGLTMSVRTSAASKKYPDLDSYCDLDGAIRISVPMDLKSAASGPIASVSDIPRDYSRSVAFRIRKNEIKIFGESEIGQSRRLLNCDYDGPELEFAIDSDELESVFRYGPDWLIRKNKKTRLPEMLAIKEGNLTFLTVLHKVLR